MEGKDTIRYKATIAYDGTDFSGFQFQHTERTVQGEIEKALTRINKNQFIRIHPAGRTDAGVHALGMIIHFDFIASIQKEGLFKALNVLTPSDISILDLVEVDKAFHARYHAIAKTYTYRIDNNSIQNPFTRRFSLHHPYTMNQEKAQAALDVIIGTHDFTSFSSIKSEVKDKVRTIYSARIEENLETKEWVFTFTGNGFLYNMIRILVGTTLEIADGRKDLSTMKAILEMQDRNMAGKTIAAQGLRLEKVYYEESELDNLY